MTFFLRTVTLVFNLLMITLWTEVRTAGLVPGLPVCGLVQI